MIDLPLTISSEFIYHYKYSGNTSVCDARGSRLSKRINPAKVGGLLLFFGLGLAVYFGAGLYKASLGAEGFKLTVNIQDPPGEVTTRPVIFDVAREGLPKKILQPGRFVLSGSRGISNATTKELHVTVQFQGFTVPYQLSSTSAQIQGQELFLSIQPGQAGGFDLNFDLAREVLDKRLILDGTVIILNRDNGTVLQRIPVRFINSDQRASA